MKPTRRDTLAMGLGATCVMISPAFAQSQIAGPSPRELTHDPDQPVLGNPDGDVTLIEFFDYQCPFCRKAHPETMDLVHKDGGIRLVLKDWPVFGPVSERATMIALGSVAGGKYPQVVEAMMAMKGRRLTDADIDKAVAKAGISPEAALESFDKGYAKWTALVGRNMGIAEMLGLMGAPSYVVGRDLFPGVTRMSVLKSAIDTARRG
ncbi:DsbA family protein [Paracoccus sp. MBLB3053]|uniref:DsbA family protein n=1 Tax=Paracoccus aurantius TaxID=3073814 RepID=A0ABU2HY92_9RHOB|nr:DsbA family protein [Paracoccus sp. MBLB3053]MDS9470011.1 DsbA family protein [Paracoccus sp. MBLB3053]